jgi:hypothetical protein
MDWQNSNRLPAIDRDTPPESLVEMGRLGTFIAINEVAGPAKAASSEEDGHRFINAG